MDWINLTEDAQLAKIEAESSNGKVFIFKHSTTCSISNAALNRLERKWNKNDSELAKPYLLDLLSYRKLSNAIANKFQVQHESPQVLIIKDGKCSFANSHFDITYDTLMEKLSA